MVCADQTRIKPDAAMKRQVDDCRVARGGVVKYAEGSCFVKFGDTHVLVTASLGKLPPWLKGQGRGWVIRIRHAAALPPNAPPRASAGKQGSHTVEFSA